MSQDWNTKVGITFAVCRKAGPERYGETRSLTGPNQSVAVVTAELADGVDGEVVRAAAHPAVVRCRHGPAGLHGADGGRPAPVARREAETDAGAGQLEKNVYTL